MASADPIPTPIRIIPIAEMLDQASMRVTARWATARMPPATTPATPSQRVMSRTTAPAVVPASTSPSSRRSA